MKLFYGIVDFSINIFVSQCIQHIVKFLIFIQLIVFQAEDGKSHFFAHYWLNTNTDTFHRNIRLMLHY